jgi:hypothetical protein
MIKAAVENAVRKFFNARGFQIVRFAASFSDEERAMLEYVADYTGQGPERLIGLMNSVRYIVENRIPGDFIECGVWRGGSMMLAAKVLMRLGDTSRHLYLYDTYEGMTAPTDNDVMFDGKSAREILDNSDKNAADDAGWCIASLEDVRANMESTGYPKDKVHFIKGPVEKTIPQPEPKQVALLRLDTDWYESTAHELKHLYSRLMPRGVLIVDDYGHWQGARKAVDEFFSRETFKPLLQRLDYTGRLAIKPENL